MITPSGNRLRMLMSVVTNADALAREVASPAWLAAARVIKHDNRTSVIAGEATVNGERCQVVVKTTLLNRPKDALAALVRRTKGFRQWRGADLLRSQSILAANPYALFDSRDAHGRHLETLVLEWIDGKTLLRHAADHDLSAEQERAVARAAGRQIVGLARARLENRDHKASNIVVRWIEGTPELVLIDTVAIRRAFGDRMRMYANLAIELMGVGALPRRTLLARALLPFAEFAKDEPASELPDLWLDVRVIIRRHGDPTPKDNPLKYG